MVARTRQKPTEHLSHYIFDFRKLRRVEPGPPKTSVLDEEPHPRHLVPNSPFAIDLHQTTLTRIPQPVLS